MNQKNKTIKVDKSTGAYISPIIKVIEIDALNVLCGSDGKNSTMNFGDDIGNNGFE